MLEDGRPVQIIDVDPVRSPETSRPDADEPWAPTAAAASGVPQHLYVDATLLQSGSVARLVKVLENNLDAVLSNGSLEIVVADPIPRQTLAATRQPEAVREALRVLGREVAGKQTLIQLRRQTVVTLRYAFTENLAKSFESSADRPGGGPTCRSPGR